MKECIEGRAPQKGVDGDRRGRIPFPIRLAEKEQPVGAEKTLVIVGELLILLGPFRGEIFLHRQRAARRHQRPGRRDEHNHPQPWERPGCDRLHHGHKYRQPRAGKPAFPVSLGAEFAGRRRGDIRSSGPPFLVAYSGGGGAEPGSKQEAIKGRRI